MFAFMIQHANWGPLPRNTQAFFQMFSFALTGVTHPKTSCINPFGRFHQVNHKCTQWRADNIPTMYGVNSEVCEQIFRWTSKYRYSFGHMNEENALFFLINVVLGRNRCAGLLFHV